MDTDIIQLPLNVFDRRLLKNGFIKKIKKKVWKFIVEVVFCKVFYCKTVLM